MLSALPCSDRRLKSWPELQNPYHAARTRRLSATRIAPTSGLIVMQIQSDSSPTDSPVRILHAQPGSPVFRELTALSFSSRRQPVRLTDSNADEKAAECLQ